MDEGIYQSHPWIHMFVDQMQSSFLRSGTDSITVFHQTSVLSFQGEMGVNHEAFRVSSTNPRSEIPSTYDLLAIGFSCVVERIMVLGDVQAEEMLGGEIPPTFGASIGVCFHVMNLVGLVGGKVEGLSMRWQSTSHDGRGGGVDGGLKVIVHMDIFRRLPWTLRAQQSGRRRVRVRTRPFCAHGRILYGRNKTVPPTIGSGSLNLWIFESLNLES